MQPKGKKKSLTQRVRERRRHLERLFKTDIWKLSNLPDRTPRAWGLRFLRVISIAASGIRETNIGNRAAALCFSSLLGIGPLIAVAFTISGFIIDRTDSDIALNAVNRAITFVAPQLSIPESGEPEELSEPEENNRTDGNEEADEDVDGEDPGLEINPELAQIIDGFIARTQSGTVGLAGMLLIILVAIQLLSSVENSFNAVWGVKRGRSMFHRIVFYWTVISLGAVLAFAALSLLSLSFTNLFQHLPLGEHLLALLQWLTPLLSLLLLLFLLTCFYRFMPNTHVTWYAAASGALIAALLLALNNALTFLYVQRVVATYNIYGSVGILPVFMLGLFVFWLILLFGAQITYAVQNANFLSNQEIWKRISHSTRELLSLIVLLLICRRFRECQPAYSSDELTSLVRAPSHVINECLSRLTDLGYLAGIPDNKSQSSPILRYQPARPLEKFTLSQFRRDFEDYGNTEAVLLLDDLDPLVKRYRDELREAESTAYGAKSVSALLDEEEATEKPAPAAKNH